MNNINTLDPSLPQSHTLAVLVDNESGVLARIVGLFSGRGYNIDSLTVTEVDAAHSRSRITIVTSGSMDVVAQIKAQIERLIPVHQVVDLTVEGHSIEREMALIKVAGIGENRVEALRIADVFRASIVDAGLESFVFEITGKPSKVDQYINLMRGIGLVEVAKTGVVAMSRGAKGM